MKKSLIIYKTFITLWRRQVKKVLNKPEKVVFAWIFVICALLLSCLCGYLLSRDIISLFLNGDLRMIYYSLTVQLITISAYVFVFFTLFKIITPEQNTITKMLSWFPVEDKYKKIGYYLPQLLNIELCALVFSSVFYLPVMIVYKVQAGIIFTFLLCIIIQSLIINLLLFAIYNLLFFILQRIKIPYCKSVTITVITLIFAIYTIKTMIGLTNSLKDYKNFNYNLFSITSPLFLKIAGINNLINVNYWIVLSIAGAVIIFFIITLHLDDIPIETRSSRLLRRIKFPENKYFSLILKEFKLLARNEEVVFHYFFIIPLAIILRVKFNINFSNIFALSIFSSLCAIPSVSSFGIEEENINIYKLLNISYLQFTISKLIADLCVSILTFICFSMIFFTKEVTFRNYLLGLVIVFISVLALYLIGVIMPINDKRPYGQGLAVFFMVVLAIPLMQISNYISQLSLVYIVLIVLLLIILIFASIFYVSKIIWLSEEHG